uniref:Guanylate cyclase n=1 Tax=Parascaris univalens TaxID=6257 RepID=A0A915B2P3_PARUN
MMTFLHLQLLASLLLSFALPVIMHRPITAHHRIRNLNRQSHNRSLVEHDVSSANPMHILFPLPKKRGRPEENPFGITMDLAKPVVDIAIEEVYRRQIVPMGSLMTHFKDTQLSDAHGPNVAINQLVEGKLDCIIGYAFVYALAPVARMSPYWKSATNNGIPVITSIGLTSNLDNRTEYQLMTRITSPYKVVTRAVTKVFDKMHWLKVAYIFNEQRHGSSDTGIPYGECYLQMASLQRLQYKKNKMDHNYFMFNELKRDQEVLRDSLRRASWRSNVIILCASPDTVREIMLAAHDLGMATSGEYVFINIDVSTGSHAEKPWIRANETNSPENEKAKQAYRALKTVSLRRSDLDEYKNFESRVKERAEKKYNYSAKTGKEYEMNNFISAFYDAVLLYAIALNETLTEGLDPRNGHNITSKMWSRTFVGITGNVSIDENGDRYSDYSLLDLDPSQEKFVEVAYYSGASNELKQVSEFHWVGGSPPKDSPICGWDHSKCPEGYPFYVYLLLGSAIFILILMCGFIYFWRRYRLEAELAAMSWKIRWEDLNGDESKKEKKKNKRSRKVHGYQYESEALLRSSSRTSVTSDKRSSSSGATRKISAMIDRKFSIFTRKKSSPTHDKNSQQINSHNHVENSQSPFASNVEGVHFKEGDVEAGDRRVSSPISTNSDATSKKKKSSNEDEFELQTKKSISLRNRKLSFGGLSIKSGGSVETIQMQNNAQIYTKTAIYKVSACALYMSDTDFNMCGKRNHFIFISLCVSLECFFMGRLNIHPYRALIYR